jgi:protein disulfide-isomerase
LFSSEANREEFLADPTPFTPVLNEIDPVVFFEERRIVPGKREWGMKDPIHQRMFFFADEASMNHFYQQYERYAQSAIDLMDRAIKVSNPGI